MSEINALRPDNISCVIVLFNPEAGVVDVAKELAQFGYPVILVVNAASQSILAALEAIQGTTVIVNPQNIGLASALNIGLKQGFEQNQSKFVALFDQDSQPETSLPMRLALELTEYQSESAACIGPQLTDKKQASATYTVNNRLLDPRIPRSIPTSGTVISKEAWLSVGPMLDALFIDGIDHEWCFRAYSKGYRVLVSEHVQMLHNMGDLGLNYFGSYKPVHRSPIRHYYIVRNTLYLMKLSFLPLQWRAVEFLKTLRRMVFYTAVSTNRTKTLKLMARAISDGLVGRLGACPIN